MLTLEKDRIQADQQAGALRVEAARTQLAASQRRAQLANQSRGYFDKSFRLGETDLPTRLRIEAEAVEAGRASFFLELYWSYAEICIDSAENAFLSFR